MYIFEAHYTNMDNDEEITRKIEFDGQFMENDKECYYIEYIKPKINVKKLKRIVSKHSRKENEQHDRLEKGDRNTAGTSGGNRQDIVSVNGLSA